MMAPKVEKCCIAAVCGACGAAWCRGAGFHKKRKRDTMEESGTAGRVCSREPVENEAKVNESSKELSFRNDTSTSSFSSRSSDCSTSLSLSQADANYTMRRRATDSESESRKRRKKDKKEKGQKNKKKQKKDKEKKKKKTHKHKKEKGREKEKNKEGPPVKMLAGGQGELFFEFQRKQQTAAAKVSQSALVSAPATSEVAATSEVLSSERKNEKKNEMEGVGAGGSGGEGVAGSRRCMVPMSREEAEKDKDKMERVFDPDTGRWRLIRGGGEVVEEIVSQQRQRAINKHATHWVSRPGAPGF